MLEPPSWVKANQVVWERKTLAARLHRLGCMTLREIGLVIGVGPARAAQLKDQGIRLRGSESPIEAWLRISSRSFNLAIETIDGLTADRQDRECEVGHSLMPTELETRTRRWLAGKKINVFF